jgi:hypothetical membrane protein
MTRTRWVVACGALGAPLFIVGFLVIGVVKPDYDPVRDFVSEGAIGPGGWMQVTDFVICGLLLTTFSFGLRHTVSRWTAWLVRLFGVCLAAAGVFVCDPVPSDVTTTHGAVHNAVSLVVFAALTAACLTAARWRPTREWRIYCVLSAITVVVFFVLAGAVDPTDGGSGIFQRISIVAGWSWLAVLALRVQRTPSRRTDGTHHHLATS